MSALNIGLGLYVDDAGVTYPITNFFNSDGEPCEEGDEIASLVAGAGDRWYTIDAAQFDRAPS